MEKERFFSVIKTKKICYKKLFFALIILCGVLFRLYFIFSRDIFTDEVFYTNVALSNSFLSILTSSHWIKDHGVLFLLILKMLTYLSKDIVILRLFNLIPYIASSAIFFDFFKKLKTGYLSLISVFVYSFLSYFVYLSATVSPFNLVSFLTLLALVSLIRCIFLKKTWKQLFLFILLSIMTFYADFSSIYFFITLIIGLFLIYLKKKEDFIHILISYLIILIGVLPGIFYVINTFGKITLLNPDRSLVNIGFFRFLTVFSDIVLLRNNNQLSLILILILFFVLIIYFLKSSQKSINFISKLFLASFLLNTVFLFVFNKHFFSIFIERSFWYFYLTEVFILTLIGWYLRARKLYLMTSLIIIFSIIIVRFFDFFGYSFPGRVPEINIKYKEFAKEVKKIPSFSQSQIIYYDQEYSYVPLRKYYFKDHIDKSLISTNDKNINANIINSSSNPIILVIFDVYNQGFFRNIKDNIRYLDKNKKIYVFTTICDKKNCNFLQIY